MPKIKLTPEVLKEYFDGKKTHEFYEKATKEAKALNTHANRKAPGEIIEERRPHEPESIKNYRLKIYRSKTKTPIQKVLNELHKIRKADDWNVSFDNDKVPTLLTEEERPQVYFEKELKGFTSLTNYAFQVQLKCALLEANSFTMMEVINHDEMEDDKSALPKPYPKWFPAESVIEYVEGELVILKSLEKNTYQEGNNTYTNGDIFLVLTPNTVTKYRQTTTTRVFTPDPAWEHNLGYIPGRKAKGLVSEVREDQILWESRISAMLDHLDEAAREYSDLQAEIVQHIHSEKWEFDPQPCTTCKGKGKVKQGQPVELIDCTVCQGSGYVATSPYMNYIVKRAQPGEPAQWTGAPAGYITKDTAIAKLQDERVDKHIWQALAAVNMEFLADVKLEQSGIAKEVDRDALNTFVNSVAEDLVEWMDDMYRIGIDIRYGTRIPDKKIREEMRPDINVPTKLDILSTKYLVDEVKALKDAKVNPVIVVASEVELANKKFTTDPDVRDLTVCVLELDPLSGISPEDKNSMLQNKGITDEDYVISCNIYNLVSLAIEEDNKFVTKKLKEKREIIQKLAVPILEKKKEKISVDFGPEPPVPPKPPVPGEGDPPPVPPPTPPSN